MNDYKQDYCEWCGKDCTELSILRTCSNQCDFERASQLVEKWRHVLDYTKTPESEEENINRLKTAVILESEEKYYFGNFREERIAEIKKRYAEFHKTYLMKKWGFIGDINKDSDKCEKVLLIEPQEEFSKIRKKE